MTNESADYFRKDQADGITAPDLSKNSTFPEHIVRARGKRTQLTSVSLEPEKIRDFGPMLYRALRSKIDEDGHSIIEHANLMESLLLAASSAKKDERARAIQAQRYAKRRIEGLVQWSFNVTGIDRKDLISWAFQNVQKYFSKV